MHFQIYIPGKATCAPEHLEEVGLATLAAGFHFVSCDQGPDGKSGCCLFWKHDGPGMNGYRPDKQDWEPAIADPGLPAGRYWIGFTKGADPSPADLARPYAHPGAVMEFGDGRAWLLPQLHQLPHELIRADNGSWQFELQRQFYGLWLKATELRPHLEQTTHWSRDLLASLAEFVLQVLALNYRLTPEVVNRLRLFTAGEEGTVVLAAALICHQLEGR